MKQSILFSFLVISNITILTSSRRSRHLLEHREQSGARHHVQLLYARSNGTSVPKVPLVEEAPHFIATSKYQKSLPINMRSII